MGPLISPAQRTVGGVLCGRCRGRVPRLCPSGAGFWYPRPCCSPAPAPSGTGARRSSARSCRCWPSTTRTRRVRLANDSEYGLSGSIWTRDLGRAIRVARGVESGNLSVNSNSSVRYWTPFGGMKQSGLGRELGPDALAAFTDVKNVFFSVRLSRLWEGRGGGSAGGPGGRRHRRGQRHRPGDGAAVRRRGRPGGRGRRRRGERDGGGRGGRRRVRALRRVVASPMWRSVRRRGRHGTDGSTSRSTTPASRRRTTTPSWPPTSTPGTGCSGSTSPRCTCAAGTSSRTCSARARVRSSTRPASWPSWAPPRRRSRTPRARAACWR